MCDGGQGKGPFSPSRHLPCAIGRDGTARSLDNFAWVGWHTALLDALETLPAAVGLGRPLPCRLPLPQSVDEQQFDGGFMHDLQIAPKEDI